MCIKHFKHGYTHTISNQITIKHQKGVNHMSKNTNTVNTPANTMKTGRWSPAENEALLKAVSHKPAKTTMTEVFNQFGSSHNRAAGSVAQHYYQLSKESSVANKPSIRSC